MADPKIVPFDSVTAVTPAPILPTPASQFDADIVNDPRFKGYGDANAQVASVIDINDRQVAPIDTPAPVVTPRKVVPFDQITDTAFDVKEDRESYQRVGVIKKEPVFNVQAVPNTVRFLTEFAFDNVDEKAAFLKKQYPDKVFAVHPHDPSQIVMKGKNDKEWGVVNPGGLTLKEAAMGVAENGDAIVQAFAIPAGVIGGLAVGGSVQALRQELKQHLLPGSDYRFDKIAIDSASGAISGGLFKAGKDVVKGVGNVARRRTGQLIEDATNPEGMLNKLGQKLNIRATPDFIMKEIGASAKESEPLQKRLLSSKIAQLQKAHPEFAQAYDSAYTLKGKFDATNEILEAAGRRIGETQVDESIKIPIQDILKSKSYQDLLKAEQTRIVGQGRRLGVKVNRTAADKIAKVRRDFLEDIGSTVLSDSPAGKKYLELYRKGTLHLYPQMKAYGLKTNEDALLYIIGNESISLPEAVMTRMGRDGVINFNKSAGQIKALNSVDKYTADAMREVIENSAKNLPDGGEQFLKDIDLFHNLHPVVKRMSATIGGQTSAKWDPVGKTLPGFINSAPRFVAKLGVNLANKTEVRTFIANLAKNQAFDLPKGGKFNGSMDLASRLSRAAKFHTSKGILDKAFSEEVSAQGLPRDVDSYFNDSGLINTLTETMGSSEETDQAIRMLERGDRESFANALSTFSAENEDLFAKAQYKSMVMDGNRLVIQDKYDREAHRKWIDKNIIDPREKFRQLKALNLTNEMVKTPYEIPLKPDLKDNIKLGKSGSTVGRVAAQLKQSESVELDDGSERQDYDY